MQELIGSGFVVRAVIDQLGKARHQRARDSAEPQDAVDVAEYVHLLSVKKMLQQILGIHAFGQARHCVGPQVEHVPSEHALVVWNEIQIDEPVEDLLAATEVQQPWRDRRGHRIGIPGEEISQTRNLLREAAQRKRRWCDRRGRVCHPAAE